MDRSVAEKLVAALADLDGQTNELCAIVETISDADERKRYRRLLAGIMEASFDVLMPAIQEHRELDPDAGTDWGRAMKARSGPRSGQTESDT
jgi:uncharacterized protein YutE (UPF0331/DUF86 family)